MRRPRGAHLGLPGELFCGGRDLGGGEAVARPAPVGICIISLIGAGCSHPCRWTGASHSRRATRSRSCAPWQRSSSCERPRWQRCGRDHGQTRFATHAKAVHRQPLRLRTIHCRHCTALQPSFPARGRGRNRPHWGARGMRGAPILGCGEGIELGRHSPGSQLIGRLKL